MFNTIGIITKPNDSLSNQKAQELSVFLKNQNIKVLFKTEQIKEQANLIIVVGGDGSLLGAARCFVDSNIPILGVNLGRLGFLADVPVDNMLKIIKQVLAGNFTKEKRKLLVCEVQQNDGIKTYLALNDLVVHRKEKLKMIDFDVFINNKIINTQRADGLIVTTPTGSTAYSLSSGGPVVHPGVNAIALVSVCPHTMSHRPLLVPEDSKILIRVTRSDEGASISFDGQVSLDIEINQDIKVRQYDKSISLIHPQDYDYFDIIRSKLGWGGTL